jgi:predicted outer membrane repeat protein
MYDREGSALLHAVSVISNTADSFGGGLYAYTGTLSVVNSTVGGNASTGMSGGGLYLNNGTAAITYTTIASNTASSGGFGLHRNEGTLSVLNTVLAYNGTLSDNCGGEITSMGYNLEYGTSCPFTATGDVIETLPLLGRLADVEGALLYPLLEDSPAIDAGQCQPGLTTVDQRGLTRPQGEGCDVGAYEREPDEFWIFLPVVMRQWP